MKKYLNANNIVLGILFAVGTYWTLTSLTLEVWVRNGPGPGLFPLIAGALCILFTLILLIRGLRDKSKSNFSVRALIPIGALLGAILLSYLIGLFLSLVLFVFLWLFVFEKKSLKDAICISIIWPGFLYMIFAVWLASPLPKGLLELL